MTPRERVMEAIALRQPDRVPVVLHSMTWAVKYAGYRFSECLVDADKFVEAQARAREEIGYDSVCSLGAIFEISEAYGSTLTFFDDDTPAVREYVLRSADDVEHLDTAADITKLGRIPFLIEVVRKLRKRVGPDVPVMAITRAPFVTAATMRGIENLYVDMLLEPEAVHRLVEFCVRACSAFAEAVADAGADLVWIGDSAATGPGVSPRHYREFGLPYAQRMVSRLRARGARTIYHVYDGSKAELAAEVGSDVLHVVAATDLASLKRSRGNQVALMGNVDALNVVYKGTPEEVMLHAGECIRAAGPAGFILADDIAAPRDTPAANIKALVKAAELEAARGRNASGFQ